jgi:hypothetical protein
VRDVCAGVLQQSQTSNQEEEDALDDPAEYELLVSLCSLLSSCAVLTIGRRPTLSMAIIAMPQVNKPIAELMSEYVKAIEPSPTVV